MGRKWGEAGESIGSVSILAQGENYCAEWIQEMKASLEVGVRGNSWEMGWFWYTWDYVVACVMVCACGLDTAFRERVAMVVTGAEDESTPSTHQDPELTL